VTERSKNPKGSAAIRGKPTLPLRKTLECRTARANASDVESTREDGPGTKPRARAVEEKTLEGNSEGAGRGRTTTSTASIRGTKP